MTIIESLICATTTQIIDVFSILLSINDEHLLCLDNQGDEWDSSDEEWDQHVGGHTRAFLGLNEPIVEIALDDGIGIGMMVRNAFALANNIHMRAAQATSPSTSVAEVGPLQDQPNGLGMADNVNNRNASEDSEDIAEFQRRPLHSNGNNDRSHDTCQHAGSDVDGGISGEEGSHSS